MRGFHSATRMIDRVIGINTGVIASVIAFSIFCCLLTIQPASALTSLRFAVQPLFSEERAQQIFRPLADFIQDATGMSCEIITFPNFISYWTTTKKGGAYDVVLDPAHFTDYRDKHQGFIPLAKQPGTLTFSLVVGEDSLVFDAEELIGKKIATLGPPSIGGVSLDDIFDNPVRQPLIVEADNAEQALDKLLAGEVDAAILPTPIVSQRMSGEGGINVVLTTDPVPSIALSVSPEVPVQARDALKKALVNADKTETGKQMLEKTKLGPFEPADASVYDGYATLLDDY